jgi:hypothetical protein
MDQKRLKQNVLSIKKFIKFLLRFLMSYTLDLKRVEKGQIRFFLPDTYTRFYRHLHG